MHAEPFNKIREQVKAVIEARGKNYNNATNKQLLKAIERCVRLGTVDKIDARFWCADVGIDYRDSELGSDRELIDEFISSATEIAQSSPQHSHAIYAAAARLKRQIEATRKAGSKRSEAKTRANQQHKGQGAPLNNKNAKRKE